MKRANMTMSALRMSGAVIVALLVANCAKHPRASESAPALPVAKVKVATVRVDEIPAITEVTGTVRPLRRAQLAAKVMGAIDELPIALGQRVKAGDLLVKISAGEISARVLQAQSQLNSARRDVERERNLLTKGASTTDVVKGFEDRLVAAEAMLREAEVMLSYTTVRAPFAGVIARRLVNEGDFASPGLPLLELEGTENFQVEAGVPDSLAAQLSVGATLTVELPGANLSFSGILAELSSAADSNAHTVSAKINVPATVAVRSGQFARVQVPGPPVRALLAPAAAVTTLGQMERVFIAREDNRAALRLVKTGPARNQQIEILGGLDHGERVVVAPPVGLREGQLLEISP